MLKKSPSPEIGKLRYLVFLPLLILIVSYASCKDDAPALTQNTIRVQNIDQMSPEEESEVFNRLTTLSESRSAWSLTVTDGTSSVNFQQADGSSYITGPNNEKIQAKMILEGAMGDDFANGLFNKVKPVPFGLVQKVPVFPGCEEADDPRACFNSKMMEHIRKNFRYPKAAIELGVEGRVDLLFTIDQEGKVTEVKSRGPNELLEAEASRIIEKLPLMKPGEQNDQVVKVYYSIPITFQLN